MDRFTAGETDPEVLKKIAVESESERAAPGSATARPKAGDTLAGRLAHQWNEQLIVPDGNLLVVERICGRRRVEDGFWKHRSTVI